MKFIKKKNMMEGEELLYLPHLHWFYTVKHLVLSLPFFAILLGLWLSIEYLVDTLDWLIGGMDVPLAKAVIQYTFIAAFAVMLFIFVCRIFLYLATEYGVTNKRLLLKKGVFRLETAEIPTDRIEGIYCIQGLLGRMLHYGNLYVSGIGGTKPVFFMAARPYALRRKIVDIIEKNKTITVVHGDLPVKPRLEYIKEPEPLYRYGNFVRVLPA